MKRQLTCGIKQHGNYLLPTAEDKKRIAEKAGKGIPLKKQIHASMQMAIHVRRGIIEAALAGYDFGLTHKEVNQMKESYA